MASGVVRRLWRKFGPITTVALLSSSMLWVYAQERPNFRIKVDMVVLSFTVTDNKGRYINGLKPKDFKILEDGIPQKINTFAEGNKPPVLVNADGTTQPLNPASLEASGGIKTDAFTGTNVFVLFDTSNYMYRGFVYASDAIADFIRGSGSGGFGGGVHVFTEFVAGFRL